MKKFNNFILFNVRRRFEVKHYLNVTFRKKLKINKHKKKMILIQHEEIKQVKNNNNKGKQLFSVHAYTIHMISQYYTGNTNPGQQK